MVRDSSVSVRLGTRSHRVCVQQVGGVCELTAVVGCARTAEDLVELLEANRTSGLAWWHVSEGEALAVSRIPPSASAEIVSLHFRETAALADRLEQRVSETDS